MLWQRATHLRLYGQIQVDLLDKRKRGCLRKWVNIIKTHHTKFSKSAVKQFYDKNKPQDQIPALHMGVVVF